MGRNQNLSQGMAALAALGVLGAAPVAHAAASVVGDGQARECWQAVVFAAPKDKALAACNGALTNEVLQRQDRAATFVNRGIIYLRDRQLDRASRDFDSALRLIPTLGEAHVNKGATLLLQNKPEQAIVALDRGLELGLSEPWSGYYNRAFAHERLGDLKAAYNDFSEAAALKPDWSAPVEELSRFTVVPANAPTDKGR